MKDVINTGDILLSESKGIIAKAIHQFQRIGNPQGFKYNHAMIAWRCYGKLFVVEATEKGIVLTDFNKHYIENEKIKSIIRLSPIFEVNGEEMGKFMLPFIGHTNYDFWNLLVAQSVRILTFNKVWIGEKRQNPHKFICGEWCYYVYQKMFPSCFKEKSQKIAPIDLYKNSLFSHLKIK